MPNLGSRVLRLTLDRLQHRLAGAYGHPVLAVETFVDPAQFCGTVYTANGWIELGQTDGWGRHRRDYYVNHDKPKRLFVPPLLGEARRSLQAEHLKPALAVVEAKVPPPARAVKEIRSIVEHFGKCPNIASGSNPTPCSPVASSSWRCSAGAPRPKGFSQVRARLEPSAATGPGDSAQRQGKYPAPSQPTFCRLLRETGPKLKQASWPFKSNCAVQHPKTN